MCYLQLKLLTLLSLFSVLMLFVLFSPVPATLPFSHVFLLSYVATELGIL